LIAASARQGVQVSLGFGVITAGNCAGAAMECKRPICFVS